MDFYNILLHAHKGFAYIELLLVTVFLIFALILFVSGGYISKTFRKITLFTMIFFHIQFLIGIVMLIKNMMNGMDMSAVMKNADLRFQYVEHPFSMLVAAVLMTIVNRKVKSSEKLTIPLLSLGVVAIALFVFAFPWMRVFG
jgi:hypothetical protein